MLNNVIKEAKKKLPLVLNTDSEKILTENKEKQPFKQETIIADTNLLIMVTC